jgi:hypothetical protein
MKEIDAVGRTLCEIQARLFEKSLILFPGSSPIFVRRFMNSEVATHFDNGSFLFESVSDEAVFDWIESEYGKRASGQKHFNANQLHWMGYLYRYWAYTEEVQSKTVFRLCQSEEMASFYLPLHTQDPAAALDSIFLSKGIKREDLNALALALLKKQKNV